MGKTLYPGHLLKNSPCNHVTLPLPEAAIPAGSNKTWETERSTGAVKACDMVLSLEGDVHVQGYEQATEVPSLAK